MKLGRRSGVAAVLAAALCGGSWWALSPAQGPIGTTSSVTFASRLPYPPTSSDHAVVRLTVLTTPRRIETWFSSVTPVMSMFATVPADTITGEGVASSAAAADSAATRLLSPAAPEHPVVVSRDGPTPPGLHVGDAVISVVPPSAAAPGVPARPAVVSVRRGGQPLTVVTPQVPETALSSGVGRPAPLLPPESSGESAGLAFALAYVDGFSPGELFPTVVAATGAIGFDGSVNPVSRLELKTQAAAEAGASVMVVPSGTTPEVVEHLRALAAPHGMDVVPVASLTDAVRMLCARGATDAVCAHLPAADPVSAAAGSAAEVGATIAGVRGAGAAQSRPVVAASVRSSDEGADGSLPGTRTLRG